MIVEKGKLDGSYGQPKFSCGRFGESLKAGHSGSIVKVKKETFNCVISGSFSLLLGHSSSVVEKEGIGAVHVDSYSLRGG